MKKQYAKTILWAAMAVLVLAGAMSGQALAAAPVYNQEGEALFFLPNTETYQGRTMIPLRAWAEYFGAEVKWAPKEITVQLRDITLWLQAGKKEVPYQRGKKQYEPILLDCAPVVKGGKTLVPLRLLTLLMTTDITYKNAEQTILFGETPFDDSSIFYGQIPQGPVDKAALEKTVAAYREKNALDYKELFAVCDRFLGSPLRQYIGSFVFDYKPQAAEAMRKSYAYYFADGVLASDGWKAFETIASTSRSELALSIIEVSSTKNKITGTFVVNLSPALSDIPLVFEAELTKKDAAWLAAAPKNTLNGWTEKKAAGWQITKISNARSYLNIQSLENHEPHIFEKWQIMRSLPTE